MKSPLSLSLLLVAGIASYGQPFPANDVHTFLSAFEKKLAPLTRDSGIYSYLASVSGKAEDQDKSEKAQLALNLLWADKDVFNKAKAWHQSKEVTDPLAKRQLEMIYLRCLSNQLPEATLVDLVQRQSELENIFNAYRPTFKGKPVSNNELRDLLKKSTSEEDLEAAWKAILSVSSAKCPDGKSLSAKIVELVKVRNKAAQGLGFKNYHAMQLELSEQNPEEIEKQFNELDELTREAYEEVKDDMDQFLANRLDIEPSELEPWHYQDMFLQKAPSIYNVDLDGFFNTKPKEAIPQLTSVYFKGMGMPVDDILERSSLYKNVYQHAFCTDIDHSGDVRILCNIVPNHYWMGTMLHEMGHGVYSKFNDPKLPWLLRDYAHTFTTEAIANLFGRFATNPAWLVDVAGVSANEAEKIKEELGKSLKLDQLVFSRWSQVMYRFEKAMYENPDQDLNTLWWDITEEYQGIERPEGRQDADWAAKIHLALYPAYYHNYLLGELLASQLDNHIRTQVIKTQGPASFANQKAVGEYLINKVFKPGAVNRWEVMVQQATGEPLTAKYYAAQFVNE